MHTTEVSACLHWKAYFTTTPQQTAGENTINLVTITSYYYGTEQKSHKSSLCIRVTTKAVQELKMMVLNKFRKLHCTLSSTETNI